MVLQIIEKQTIKGHNTGFQFKKAFKIVYMLFLSRKRAFSLSLLYKLDGIVLRKEKSKEKSKELINNAFVTLP